MKGLKQHKLFASPDRLRHPVKRVGGELVRVSWEQAIWRRSAPRCKQIRARYCPDAIAMYVGTAAGFGVLHPVFAQGFMTGVGSKSMYASATQDCANKFAVARQIYGFPFTQPFPDVDHTECLIIVGANPVVSKWSFLQVSNPIERLARDRGARRPVYRRRSAPHRDGQGRRASTSSSAPAPTSSSSSSFLHELIATGGVDRARVARFMTGFDEVERLVAPGRPSAPAQVTRHRRRRSCARWSPPTARRRGAALYCSTGVNMGGHGVARVLAPGGASTPLSGNLDRRGGTLVGRGRHRLPALRREERRADARRPLAHRRLRVGERRLSRRHPGRRDPDPGTAAGARALRDRRQPADHDGERRAAAPRRSSRSSCWSCSTSSATRPASPRALRAAVHGAAPAARSAVHLPAHARPAVEALPAGHRARSSRPTASSATRPPSTSTSRARRASPSSARALAQWALEAAKWLHSAAPARAAARDPAGAAALAAAARDGQRRLREAARRAARPAAARRIAKTISSASASSPTTAACTSPRRRCSTQARELDAAFDRERASAGRLRLITQARRWRPTTRGRTTSRSSSPATAAPTTSTCTRRTPRGPGSPTATSPTCRRRPRPCAFPSALLDELMPGTVALPHGWGHQHATGLSVASRTRGVNVNLLAADGPDAIERISGMARLTGIPVDVRPAAGPQAAESWSGLPEA